MKYKLTRTNQQLLLSLAVFGSTIMPVTSAIAILPLGSEFFQTELSETTSSTETALIKKALSKEGNLKRENEHLTAFSNKSKFSTLIRESKQFRDLEKHNTDILHD
ncbi:hypothetical protein [Psychrobacter fozii]|uniref:hypothetical protein n=1 Tax=Psychrobacter fozii TaxID=198480 RepID=UPI00191A48C3|nr:hypothetical protein [Psychrobacter fozii]